MLADQVSDAMRDMDDKDRERDNAMSRDAHSMEAVFDLIAGLESKDTILENPKIDWYSFFLENIHCECTLITTTKTGPR